MSGSILNYTQHPIVVYNKQSGPDRVIIATLKSDGALFCATERQVPLDSFEVAPGVSVGVVTAPRFTRVTPYDLMDQARGHHIIVGMPVGNYLATMAYEVLKTTEPGYGILSVLGPDTGPDAVVRDEHGNIIGTTRFIKYV